MASKIVIYNEETLSKWENNVDLFFFRFWMKEREGKKIEKVEEIEQYHNKGKRIRKS